MVVHLFGKLWQWLWVGLVLLPIGVIVASYQQIDQAIWAHLLDFQLLTLLSNTFLLLLGVGLGVVLLGTSSAWLTAVYQFPGRGLFFWALMLPLALPAYVMAFSQLGLFDYTGPISTYLRERWQFQNGLPEIRHAGGVIAVMSLAFYPYVYLLARNAFSSMGQRALEVGASLGLNPWQAFFKVALPMARPWIVGGMVLALMETLADFGTVAIFNYDTFTTAIYQAWFAFYSLETAKQLASLLILLVFVLLLLEQYRRRQRRFTQTGRAQAALRRPLHGGRAWLASGYCGLLFLIAFVLPVAQLVYWAIGTWDNAFETDLWQYAWHSFVLALGAAFLVLVAALGLALSKRANPGRQSLWLTRIATLGYAIPGTVLAVGVFVPIAWLDHLVIEQFGLGESGGAWLKGSLAALFLAYALRFMAVAFAAVEAGLERIAPHQEEAARTLGVHGVGLLRRVYLPLLQGALGTAMLMVFVDVMKEMPITLMMRPFDWDTLAVRIFNFTTEGQYDLAAWPSLLIVITGFVPILLFSRTEQSA